MSFGCPIYLTIFAKKARENKWGGETEDWWEDPDPESQEKARNARKTFYGGKENPLHPESNEFKRFEEFISRRNRQSKEGPKHLSKVMKIAILCVLFNLYILTISGDKDKLEEQDKIFFENLSKIWNKDKIEEQDKTPETNQLKSKSDFDKYFEEHGIVSQVK